MSVELVSVFTVQCLLFSITNTHTEAETAHARTISCLQNFKHFCSSSISSRCLLAVRVIHLTNANTQMNFPVAEETNILIAKMINFLLIPIFSTKSISIFKRNTKWKINTLQSLWMQWHNEPKKKFAHAHNKCCINKCSIMLLMGFLGWFFFVYYFKLEKYLVSIRFDQLKVVLLERQISHFKSNKNIVLFSKRINVSAGNSVAWAVITWKNSPSDNKMGWWASENLLLNHIIKYHVAWKYLLASNFTEQI